MSEILDQFTMDEAREVIRLFVAEHEMDVNLDRVRVLPRLSIMRRVLTPVDT